MALNMPLNDALSWARDCSVEERLQLMVTLLTELKASVAATPAPAAEPAKAAVAAVAEPVAELAAEPAKAAAAAEPQGRKTEWTSGIKAVGEIIKSVEGFKQAHRMAFSSTLRTAYPSTWTTLSREKVLEAYMNWMETHSEVGSRHSGSGGGSSAGSVVSSVSSSKAGASAEKAAAKAAKAAEKAAEKAAKEEAKAAARAAKEEAKAEKAALAAEKAAAKAAAAAEKAIAKAAKGAKAPSKPAAAAAKVIHEEDQVFIHEGVSYLRVENDLWDANLTYVGKWDASTKSIRTDGPAPAIQMTWADAEDITA